jgi:glc operon protein GlcG
MPVQRPSLSLEEARRCLDRILQEADRNREQPIAVCICDEQGELVAFARQDFCRPQPLQIARKKAYTAARIGQDTRAYAERLRQQDRSVTEFGDPNLIALQGGCVIVDPGSQRPIGGVGVSGRTAEEDEQLAKLGLESLQQRR